MVMPRSRSCGSKSVDDAGGVEDAFGDGGLARVDVGEDAQVADGGQRTGGGGGGGGLKGLKGQVGTHGPCLSE
jgi:hypothetical protein